MRKAEEKKREEEEKKRAAELVRSYQSAVCSQSFCRGVSILLVSYNKTVGFAFKREMQYFFLFCFKFINVIVSVWKFLFYFWKSSKVDVT